VRIVFFGTPALAVPSLEGVAARHQVTALVCQPDRPRGRSKRPAAPLTKVWALDHGLPVTQPAKLNDGAFEAWLKAQAPEVCVVVAYGRILKQPVLDVPAQGFINVHASLLPRHRGASPIQSALRCGDEVTGVTIMRLDAGMDTGDLVLQESTGIAEDDTTASLSERLAVRGAELLLRALDLIAAGEATFTPQDESQATVTRLYEKSDGQIRWGASAREIHNLVRAAIPWPVAHCRLQGDVCRIHKTEVVDESVQAPPGSVTTVERDRVLVAAGAGQVAILMLQAAGKRAMAVRDFLNGRTLKVGDRFEEL